MPSVPGLAHTLGGPGLEVLAPFAGTVIALEDVPDPVFAQAMVGPGVALEPAESAAGHGDDPLPVRAPIDGDIVTLMPHGFVVSRDERAVLVHLGLDTVKLAGRGFEPDVAIDQPVRRQDVVMRWSPRVVVAAGYRSMTPVVALEASARDVVVLVAPGDKVEAGQPLLLWT